ncbi:MAG: hypothetical protein JOY96_04530, partial [Verrucomicrobia bacterium]|nr:hypothetical protein [Verrucomicrobiota bacterium]
MKSHLQALSLAAVTFFPWGVNGLAYEIGESNASRALDQKVSWPVIQIGVYHPDDKYDERSANFYDSRDPDRYFTRYPDKYLPTPEQRKTALQRVAAFFEAIFHHRQSAPKHHYIAIETLRPNSRQLSLYNFRRAAAIREAQAKKTKLASHWVAPKELHCVMLFDTQSLQLVGNNCYLIPHIPPNGETVRFDTI